MPANVRVVVATCCVTIGAVPRRVDHRPDPARVRPARCAGRVPRARRPGTDGARSRKTRRGHAVGCSKLERVAELEIRQRFDAADMTGAMQLALEAYGDELYGFLVGLSHDRSFADDVFGATCERLWRALPKFRWESTLRTWAYTIARNEFLALRSSPQQRREVPVSEIPGLHETAVQIRTRTPVHQRSEVRERFAQLREELAPDDHMLLGLRLEQRMSWDDIARVLGQTEDPARATAVLRKRYQRLKERLRELVARSADA